MLPRLRRIGLQMRLQQWPRQRRMLTLLGAALFCCGGDVRQWAEQGLHHIHVGRAGVDMALSTAKGTVVEEVFPVQQLNSCGGLGARLREHTLPMQE
jgi:hypothetical protein